MANVIEVTLHSKDWAKIACSSGRKEEEFIEELEGRGRGLMDTGNNDYLQ
jgi:hypothetical protein